MTNQHSNINTISKLMHYSICGTCSGEMMYLCDWPENGILRCVQCGETRNLEFKNSINKTNVA